MGLFLVALTQHFAHDVTDDGGQAFGQAVELGVHAIDFLIDSIDLALDMIEPSLDGCEIVAVAPG